MQQGSGAVLLELASGRTDSLLIEMRQPGPEPVQLFITLEVLGFWCSSEPRNPRLIVNLLTKNERTPARKKQQ